MLDWQQLVRCSDAELSRLDIAQVNLACADGLPGSEKIDEQRCLQTLDRWAEEVKAYTSRIEGRFWDRPERYNHSWAFFRILAMVTKLQRDLGVKYNPAKIPEDAPFTTEDAFIHGFIQGEGGTCATMPVVYVAVGRRLGYPLHLVHATGGKYAHLFARWVEPIERFNIEATAQGLSTPPDDYYRTGRYAIPPDVERKGCYLQSMTRRQELAMFLIQRGCHFRQLGRYRQAVNSFAWASAAVPEDLACRNTLLIDMRHWADELKKLRPPGYPAMHFRWPPRRFPATLPWEIERHLLSLEAAENLLKDQRLNEPWWEPQRLGQPMGRQPARALVDMTPTHCSISFDFD
jgi:hypothetical protein